MTETTVTTIAPAAHALLTEEEATRSPVVVGIGVSHPQPTKAAALEGNKPIVEQLHKYLTLNPLAVPSPPPPPPPASAPQVDAWNPIVFPAPTPVGGWATVTVYPDGQWNFAGSLHDSGAFSYSDQIVFVLKAANGAAFSFAHSGGIHGAFDSGSRDDSWNESGTNPALADAFDSLAAGNWQAKASVNWDVGALIKEIEDALEVAGSVIALA